MSDITVKPSLDEIVSLLGRFFGTTSKSAFLSLDNPADLRQQLKLLPPY